MLAAAVLAAGAAATAPATPAQLALMPLPKSALPAAAGALLLDRGSGIVSNADAADDATGVVTARRLARLGRLTGYSLDYADSGLSALVRGRGLLGIETSVDLYRDVELRARGWPSGVPTRPGHEAEAVRRRDAFQPVAAPRSATSAGASPGRSRSAGYPPIYGVDVVFRVGAIVATSRSLRRRADRPRRHHACPAVRATYPRRARRR